MQYWIIAFTAALITVIGTAAGAAGAAISLIAFSSSGEAAPSGAAACRLRTRKVSTRNCAFNLPRRCLWVALAGQKLPICGSTNR